MQFQIVLIILVTALPNPWIEARPMDKVDECLFTCDYCFKGEVLLSCANQCLVTGDNMNYPWTSICPYFGYMEFNKR